MHGQSGRTLVGFALSIPILFALALTIVLSQAGTARANNVVTNGTVDCDGHWTYNARYLGNGGGSSDNRLVVIDVNVGGNVIRQYQYFDTLTFAAHPAPPAGFTLVDNPTSNNSILFSLSGTGSFAVSGSIKLYQQGVTSSPSADPYYNQYLPADSADPILPPASTCATATSTSTATRTSTATSTATRTSTPTATSTSTSTSTFTPTATFTATPTYTPSGPVFASVGLSVDRTQVGAGLGDVPIDDIPVGVVTGGGEPGSSRISNVDFQSSALSSIALSSIALSSIGTQSSALSSIALSSIPITTPGGWDAVLAGTALEGVPPQSVTLADVLALNPQPAALSSITLGQLDLGASTLQGLRLVSVALGATALSSIPVPGGASDWCQALANVGFDCATAGLNSTTVGSATLLQLDAAGAPIESLALSSIALSSIDLSSSALSSIALSSIALSSIALSSIHLGDIALSSIDVQGAALSSIALSSIAPPDGQATWCDQFAAEGHDCTSLGITDSSTLYEVVTALEANSISLQSTALSSIALSSIALSSIAPSSLALSSIALSSIAVNGTALSSIALSSIATQTTALSSIALSSIALSSINPNSSALSSIALSSIANVNTVVNCSLVNCATATLGQAADAGAILPTATLGQLAGTFGTFTLADLGVYGTATVQDILTALGATPDQLTYFLSFLYGDATIGGVQNDLGGLTLGEILVAILQRSDYPWEDTSLDLLSQADLPAGDNANVLNYRATFTYLGGSSATSVNVEVTLPSGFHYIKGSSLLSVSPAAPAPVADPDVNGDVVTWTLPAFAAGAQAALDFQVRPGLVLGPGNTSAITVSDEGHPAVTLTDQAPVTVIENFEPNNDPSNARAAGPDRLIISHISTPGDRDFFTIPADLPPGSRIEILLSHQAQDNDIALFRPTAEALRPPSGAALSSIPLDDAPDTSGPTTNPPSQVLQDVNIPSSLALSSISANRGTDDDGVSTMALSDSGVFTIEVAGYNGGYSNQPYVLREKVSPPPVAPQCAARTFPFAGQGVAGTLPASLPSSVNTLFLVDQKRLGDLYGSAKAADVMTALNTLAARGDLGVAGAVLPVEGDSAVAQAYAAWDANPCNPAGANGVVTAINAVVDGYRATLPDLQNVVIVGDDDVVPFARIPDLTHVSNESDYTPDILQVAGQEALLGSFITSSVLSDNPYGAFHPVEWLDHELYVPNVALGRMVETPEQIVAQVNQFISAQGVLDPQTAVTTGYDFLSDGASAVADGVDNVVGAANDTRLINDTWTSADLANDFNNHTPVPDIASINAHYDHHRLLPGAGNTTGDESDLYTTQNIARPPLSPQILPARVLFSMGCHGGLNVSDAFAGTPSAQQAALLLDWPQAYADQGAAVYVGNTGYGYGDSDIVAYSEELMSQFSQRLDDGITIGQALTFAKQAYYGGLAQYETYDEKVLSETAFYGLPMFRIAQPQAPLTAGPQSTVPVGPQLPFTTDAITGLPAVQFLLTSNFVEHDLGVAGSYFTVDGDSDASSGRPIQPITTVDLPGGEGGSTAHGIIITGATSSDVQDFNPVFSKPDVDSAGPEQASDDPFPASLHNLTTFFAPSGQEQAAVFSPAMFIPGSTPGIGTERLFPSIDASVLYSNSTDMTPPTIIESHAANINGVISFSVRALDDQPDNVVRVFVLYKADGSNDWVSLDLLNTPGTDRWSSSANLNTGLSYFVYAIDGAGNVAVSSNKAELYHVLSIAPPSGLSLNVNGPQANGWYTNALVSVSGAAGVSFDISVDGGAFQPYTGSFPLTGDGLHLITAQGSDGSQGTISAGVDSAPPAITISAPADGVTYKLHQVVDAAYACIDGGSGVQSCGGDVADGAAIDTSTAGSKSFTVSTQDVAGFSTSLAHTYTVSSCDIGDTDCDTMLDTYELANPCLNVNVSDGTTDTDGDGLTNLQEQADGTNPCAADTDGDGMPDGYEAAHTCVSALSADGTGDPDADGLTSATESTLATNACARDTDTDGCNDKEELGPTPSLGGRRDPVSYWDFYDVGSSRGGVGAGDENFARDGKVTFNDALIILDHFGHNGLDAHDHDLDRVIPDATKPWRTAEGLPGDSVTLTDVTNNLKSFGDTCTG